MVGAAPEVFARIEPVLRAWAGNVVHLGPVGLGHKMKLINNFVAMGYAALYSEAMAIARKAGLSIEQFHAVIGSGRMRSPFYDTFMQWSLNHDENAHRFTISNAHKDMRYLASMAGELGAVNPIQADVKNLFAAMEAAGQGERFVPMLADFKPSGQYVMEDLQAVGGIPAVLLAAFVVKSLDLVTLRWLVVAVVLYAAALLLRSAFQKKPEASAAAA